MYDAERQIVKALPKMVKACSTPELGEARLCAPSVPRTGRLAVANDAKPDPFAGSSFVRASLCCDAAGSCLSG